MGTGYFMWFVVSILICIGVSVLAIKKRKRSVRLIAYLMGSVVAVWGVVILTTSITFSEQGGQNNNKYEKVKSEIVKTKEEIPDKYKKSLGLTVNMLRDRFDQYSREYELGYESDRTAPIFRGDVYDVISLTSEENPIQTIVYLTKDKNEVSRLTVGLLNVEQGKLEEQNIKLKETIEVLIKTIEGQEDEGTVKELVSELYLVGNSEVKEQVIGDTLYSLSKSKESGYMLFVE